MLVYQRVNIPIPWIYHALLSLIRWDFSSIIASRLEITKNKMGSEVQVSAKNSQKKANKRIEKIPMEMEDDPFPNWDVLAPFRVDIREKVELLTALCKYQAPNMAFYVDSTSMIRKKDLEWYILYHI